MAHRGGGDQTVVVVVRAVCGRGGLVSFVGRGLRVVGSSPTVVVWSRCDRTRREGTPARLYRIKTHGVHFLLGVCVCVRGPRL